MDIEKMIKVLKYSQHQIITEAYDEQTDKIYKLLSIQMEEGVLNELIQFLESCNSDPTEEYYSGADPYRVVKEASQAVNRTIRELTDKMAKEIKVIYDKVDKKDPTGW